MDLLQKEQKKLETATASLIALKAELFRKRNDFQTQLSSTSSTSITSQTPLKSKNDEQISQKRKLSTSKELLRPTTSITPTMSREEEIAFSKSRAILEVKSKVFDEMMKDGHMVRDDDDDDDDDGDDDGEMCLVDFERKLYEDNNNTTTTEQTTISPTSDDKDEQSESGIDRAERLHREQMREKREQDIQAACDKTQLHYQDVLFDGKGEHAVGYYQFSKDEQTRAEQMNTLNELRTKTKQDQKTSLLEKEKRRQFMANRLNKIRQRKAKELEITSEDGGVTDGQAESSDIQSVEKAQNKAETITTIDQEEQKQTSVQQLSELLFQPPPPPPSSEEVIPFVVQAHHQQAPIFYPHSLSSILCEQPQSAVISVPASTCSASSWIDQTKSKSTDEVLKPIEENKISVIDDKQEEDDEERKRTELAKKALFPRSNGPSFPELMDNLRGERRLEFAPIYKDDEEEGKPKVTTKPVGSLLAKRIKWDEINKKKDVPYGRYGSMNSNNNNNNYYQNPYEQYYNNANNQHYQQQQPRQTPRYQNPQHTQTQEQIQYYQHQMQQHQGQMRQQMEQVYNSYQGDNNNNANNQYSSYPYGTHDPYLPWYPYQQQQSDLSSQGQYWS
ncbi:unnamed protein product [Didymodactylos carnosus]|uniref:Uncharacterized protein n=1 Tax=Didymodactylos carnosus TaxID=1234261 RepID=A0A8S2E6X5_9BILA|nr:unnamed protein product [Didymodactylos carnosus]CAF3868716.1 unnamed protein product [Didymodactylos carnosus]